MSHLRAMPPKKSNYELAEELERLILMLPMIEAQRQIIKEAAERLKYLDD